MTFKYYRALLWFDVGIKRYTTKIRLNLADTSLWFDVGIKRYTTRYVDNIKDRRLWFDVGIKRYTTPSLPYKQAPSCGLM